MKKLSFVLALAIAFATPADVQSQAPADTIPLWRGVGTVFSHLPQKAISAAEYGVKCDGASIASSAVTIASGSAALTVVGAAFTSADVGKAISVPGAGTGGGTLNTTIAAFTDATHVTLAVTASTALAAASATVAYGTDDTAAFGAVAAAANAAVSSRIELPVTRTCVVWPSDASVTGTPNLILLSGVKSTTVNFNGSCLHSLFTGGFTGYGIRLASSNRVDINDYCHVSDRGKGVGTNGVWHIIAENGVTGVSLNRLTAIGGLMAFGAARTPGSAVARSSDFRVDIRATDVFYGINGQWDLDNLRGYINCTNAGRCLFPNGNMRDWDMTVESKNPTGFGDVNISCQATETTDEDVVSAMRVRYINRNSTIASNAWVFIGALQYPTNAATQSCRINADIEIDAASPGALQTGIVAQSFTRTGPGTQALGDAGHELQIRLSGTILGPMDTVAQLGTSANGWGNTSKINVSTRDLVVPTSSGTFAIGAGTLSRYTFVNTEIPSGTLTPDAVTGQLVAVNTKFANLDGELFRGQSSFVVKGPTTPGTTPSMIATNNTGALPVPTTNGTILQAAAVDGWPTAVHLDAFGNFPVVWTRAAGGTVAAPAAVQNGDFLGLYGATGRGATAYAAGARAYLGFQACENWTDSAQGTCVTLATTPAGSTTPATQVRVNPSGVVDLTTVNATTSYQLNGAQLAAPAGSYFQFNSPDHAAMFLGNTAIPANVFDNTTHTWRSRGGGTTFANLTANGLAIGPTLPTFGSGSALGMGKMTASGSAPGAAAAKLEVVCGTAAGSAKLIMYAGTSTTPVTVVDNVGSGVTGC